MNKKAFMIILLLALTGSVLIGLSILLLYQGSSYANEKAIKAKNELELANKQIEVLNQDLKEKPFSIIESEEKYKTTRTDNFSRVTSKNLPIIEITNTDLGGGTTIDDSNKKVHLLMYSHQIRFYLLNVGESSLKEVIFSIKDVYNSPKEKKKNKKPSTSQNYMGQFVNYDEIGSFENIEVGILNLKSKKLLYSSNLPSSFGVGDYTFEVIVEWYNGSYQMKVDIEEVDGKLKFKYKFYNVNGEPINFNKAENTSA
jgi:Txe/YoeB family toxin of Txe-Axe toxin-antitoxin module